MSLPVLYVVSCVIHVQGNENLAEDLQQWLAAQARPVIILHHETPAAYHYIERTLAASTVTPLTEFQISQYQVTFLIAIESSLRLEVIHDFLSFVYVSIDLLVDRCGHDLTCRRSHILCCFNGSHPGQFVICEISIRKNA